MPLSPLFRVCHRMAFSVSVIHSLWKELHRFERSKAKGWLEGAAWLDRGLLPSLIFDSQRLDAVGSLRRHASPITREGRFTRDAQGLHAWVNTRHRYATWDRRLGHVNLDDGSLFVRNTGASEQRQVRDTMSARHALSCFGCSGRYTERECA